jgi:hypothetical protein
VSDTEAIYGTVAEFDNPDALVEAARKVRHDGYKHFETYAPYAIEELSKIVPRINPVPLFTLVGGLTGAAIAWAMQYYIAAIDYPINVGGRPLYSWPAFIPILFELTVLCAAIACFFGTLAICRFPKPHFELFNVPAFLRASSNRFFLCIRSTDPMYQQGFTAEVLKELGATGVWEVENS